MPEKTKRYAFTVTYPSRISIIATKIEVKPCQLLVETNLNLQTNAVWDTGATRSVISTRLAESLKLIPTGITEVSGVHGKKNCSNYLIDVVLPNQVMIQQVSVIESSEIPFDVLVGMDIIGFGDFCLSNANNKTKFTFQIPSTHETDYVSEINDSNKKNDKLKKTTTDDIRAFLAKRRK